MLIADLHDFCGIYNSALANGPACRPRSTHQSCFYILLILVDI